MAGEKKLVYQQSKIADFFNRHQIGKTERDNGIGVNAYSVC